MQLCPTEAGAGLAGGSVFVGEKFIIRIARKNMVMRTQTSRMTEADSEGGTLFNERHDERHTVKSVEDLPNCNHFRISELCP